MVWKERTPKEIGVTGEYAELMKKAIYYNSDGELSDSSLQYRIQYITVTTLIWIILIFIIRSFFLLFWSVTVVNIIILILAVVSYPTFLFLLYLWGWKNYKEAWYYFDNKDEIFFVVQEGKNGWDIIEIPYEEIQKIEYVDGPNGKAVLYAANFQFATNRANDKRASSLTELWPELSKIGAKMISWPYTLYCPVCHRKFGNHTGTAICPMDEVILIDPEVKGRMDPEKIHSDDFDRL